MDRRILLHLGLLGLVLVSCLPAPASEAVTSILSIQPEPNFAFYFAYGPCGGALDTFENTYRTAIYDGEPITIPVTLTDEQMMTIYQKMVAIDFFSYPETFRILNGTAMVTPAPEYRIKVRNGELTHSVFWVDEIFEPTNREADQLRELIQIIMRVIETHPDIQNLPPKNYGCA